MALGSDIVAGVSRRLAEHAGFELPAWVVEARASARIALLAISPEAYVELIKTVRGAAELEELVESVRVGETRLFRHRSQIAALVDVIAPAIRARGKRAIRVWSAGCSAGEEPYTLAAVLKHALPNVGVAVVATDVSADALEVAKRATYPASAWNDIPEEYRDYFQLDGDSVRVVPEIANLVRFERANLAASLDPSPIKNCDIVWCRNVLIYFTARARRLVIDRLLAATNPGGYIFVGYSENLRDIDGLEPQRAGDAVFYARVAPPSPTNGIAIPRTITPGRLVVHGVERTPSAGVPLIAMPASADYTPPPVLLTEEPHEDVLLLRGHPNARAVTAELTARLAITGLHRLVVDLDGAELLGDDLAPVLRRARAAAHTAHVVLVLRATRTGSRRWLARHELDGGSP